MQKNFCRILLSVAFLTSTTGFIFATENDQPKLKKTIEERKLKLKETKAKTNLLREKNREKEIEALHYSPLKHVITEGSKTLQIGIEKTTETINVCAENGLKTSLIAFSSSATIIIVAFLFNLETLKKILLS